MGHGTSTGYYSFTGSYGMRASPHDIKSHCSTQLTVKYDGFSDEDIARNQFLAIEEAIQKVEDIAWEKIQAAVESNKADRSHCSWFFQNSIRLG